MKCQNQFKVGDVILYVLPFNEKLDIYKTHRYVVCANVEVLKKFNHYAECKILNLVCDNSGNGYYHYLWYTGKVCYCSLEYLHYIKIG